MFLRFLEQGVNLLLRPVLGLEEANLHGVCQSKDGMVLVLVKRVDLCPQPGIQSLREPARPEAGRTSMMARQPRRKATLASASKVRQYVPSNVGQAQRRRERTQTFKAGHQPAFRWSALLDDGLETQPTPTAPTPLGVHSGTTIKPCGN